MKLHCILLNGPHFLNLGAIMNNASAARYITSQSGKENDEIGEILEDIIKDINRAGQIIRKIRGIVKKKGGLGIGLRLCRSIVEKHGGRLWLENNRQLGLIFVFSLKATPGESQF